MKQPIEIVTLPTENITNLVSDTINNNLFFTTSNNLKPFEYQHLYITVSQDVEPIKKGDWYYLKETREGGSKSGIYFSKGTVSNKLTNISKNTWKIIATTDKSLKIELDYHKKFTTDFEKVVYIENLPQPPQSFLKEYCNNPDGEWEIEYYYEGKCEDPMVCLRGCSISEGTCKHHINKKSILKINRDNTVNITSVENKMYTKEEVISKIKEALTDEILIDRHERWTGSRLDCVFYKINEESFKNWIEENL